MTRDPRLRSILEELAQVIEDRLAHHPSNHLTRHRRPTLDLRLSVPIQRQAVDDEQAESLARYLDDEIAAHLAHDAILKPGHVYCLRCNDAGCEHSTIENERQVFAGYGPSGMPRFLDFGQWVLERQSPHLDRLYQKPPRLVTDVISGRDLDAQLLPAFRDRKTHFRLHGQVTAGWFRLPRRDRTLGSLAVTFQILSSAKKSGKKTRFRRLGLNLLVRGFDDEPLEALYDRVDEVPWSAAVTWGQEALDSIERSQYKKSTSGNNLERRIDGVLQGIGRRLQHDRRAREKRTDHAQQRHDEGDRPTRLAQRDLAQAKDERILFDTRRKTLVVLGPRGRAHVWSPAGKLVTSLRASPDSIQRKRKLKIWRPATQDEINTLRKTSGIDTAASV